MNNPYEPPSDVPDPDDSSDGTTGSDESASPDKLSGRLVFAYLAFIVLYVVVVDFLFRSQ